MDFPLAPLMNEETCYRKLLTLLHSRGLACPRCGRSEHLLVHRRHRAPVVDYRCGGCGRVFNAFTGTSLHGTHRRPSELVAILHGISRGQSTASLARELGCGRSHLLQLRHRWQERSAQAPWDALADPVVEADEMYQNAGEKRRAASRSPRSAAPPRQ